MSERAHVHDLGANRLAELLEEIFSASSQIAHLHSSDGDNGITMKRGLVRQDLEDHVRGRARKGVIPFIDELHVGWSCIDLDVTKWGMEPDDLEAFAMINAIMSALAAHGIHAKLARSRRKGWHIWVFFSASVSAARVRAFLRRIALEAGAQDAADLVCPRGDSRRKCGNGMWLPLAGMSREPFTHFYELDADSGDWLPSENQAAVLRSIITEQNDPARVPEMEAKRGEDREKDHARPVEGLIRKGDQHNTLVSMAGSMRRRGHTANEIFAALQVVNAERLEEPAPEENIRRIAESVAQYSPADAGDVDDTPPIRSYLHLFPTAEDLRALKNAPKLCAICTHLLYPQTTTVFAGQTGLGKTTALVRVATDLAYAREPWTGNHDKNRERMRVLIVSRDDTTLSLVRKVVALAPDDEWMSDGRITLVGKEKKPLKLTDQGVEVLGNTISDGRFDVAVIDPYAHFLPPGLTVNDDAAAEHTISALDGIATSLKVSNAVVHHPRKRAPKAKSPMDMTKGERLEEIRGSAVLAQLARAVATLWETEPGRRMLDAVVNDAPPMAELHFQTSKIGEAQIRWEIAGPPVHEEDDLLRTRIEQLPAGSYNLTELARHLFAIPYASKPSGQRRDQAKMIARRMADSNAARFSLMGDKKLVVNQMVAPL